ncbi:MAG: tetratricopeptide repeat protein [Fuerstiella sp.]
MTVRYPLSFHTRALDEIVFQDSGMTVKTLQGLLLMQLFVVPLGRLHAQETGAATRQYAVAVGFQNQKVFDTAIDEWQTFLKKFPDDPRADRASHYLGTCCLQEKRYGEAVAAFETVIRRYPRCELLDQSMLNLGIAEYAIAQNSSRPDDYVKAEKTFGQMLAKFGDSPYAARALFYRGECLYQLNQFDQATAVYADFVRRFPEDELAADAIYALGTSQEQLQQPADALATFTSLVTKFPEHPLLTEVQMRRAEILFSQSRFDQAQPLFEAVSSKRDFELADVAMLRHARCLYEQGRLSDAARLYWNVPREFRKTTHYDAAILAGAKCYFLEENYALARSGLEQVAGRNVPEAAEATEWLARSFLKEGNARQALTTAEAGLKKFRGDSFRPELQLVRIDALFELPERKSETVELYAAFVRTNPAHELAPQAQYMAALAALDTQNHQAASERCDEFLKQFSSSRLKPDVLFIAAESRLLPGEYGPAADLYQTFLATDGDHPNAAQAKLRRGLALHMAGDHQQAIRWLNTVLPQMSDKSLRSEAYSISGRSLSAMKDYAAAADQLQKGLQEQPDRPQNDETLLALADAFRQLGRDDEADVQLRKLLTGYPGSRLASEAGYRLGEAAYAQQRFQQAMTAYQSVVDNWSDSEFAPHAQYGLGWTLFNLGEYRKSADAMTRLVERYRTSKPAPKGLYVRAMAAYQLGDYPDVLNDVESFLATKPDQNDALDARYVQGLAQAGLKKFDEAARTYASILKTGKSYPAADKVAYELGWAFVELGQTDQAVAAFRQLATDYPDSPLAAEALFRVGEARYDAEDFAAAKVAYQQAAEKSGTAEITEKSLHKLGWSLLKDNDIDAARSAFQRQLDKVAGGPLAGDARFLIGECSFKQQNWNAARQAFEKVASEKTGNYVALAMFRAGECAASAEDWNSSRSWHQKVLDQYPEFEMRPEARYGLAWALQNEGLFEQAVPLYEQVTEETQTETAAKARFMIGECCFARKEHKEATRHFLKAAFLYNHPEWSPMAYFEAARCFEVLRDVEQARSCYEQLVTKFPQHAKVRDARRRLDELNGS